MEQFDRRAQAHALDCLSDRERSDIGIAPANRHLVTGLGAVDSLALDPRKWLHAPFDIGCALIRDRAAHPGSFSLTPAYLQKTARGIASDEWLFDYGVQTLRGFRVLKVWMALQEHGLEKFGRLVDQSIAQARYLSDRIGAEDGLELVSNPVINMICCRFNPGGLNEKSLRDLNTEIMLRPQETGVAALSDTHVHGKRCMREAITNHRTGFFDLDQLVLEVLRTGVEIRCNTQ